MSKGYHPTIAKIGSVADKEGYTLIHHSQKSYVDPHTKEKVKTSKVILASAGPRMSVGINKLLTAEGFGKAKAGSHQLISPNRGVSIKVRNRVDWPGHQIHITSVEHDI